MIQIDMPMPQVCDECKFYDDNGDYPYCIVTGTRRGYNYRGREQRMDDCPLQEIKKTCSSCRHFGYETDLDTYLITKRWCSLLDIEINNDTPACGSYYEWS